MPLLRVQPHLLALNRAKIPRGLALSVPLNSNRFVGIPFGNATFNPVPTITGSPQLARTPWGVGLKADGTATTLAYALHTGQASATFWSLEAFVWVTSSTADGGVCGWDDSTNASSGVTDRYLSTANTVTNWFTDLYDGGNSTITAGSAAPGIHHIVCTYGNDVQSLYVDGLLAGSNTGVTSGGYTGYATPNFLIGATSTVYPDSFNGGVILLVNWANACWDYNEVRARYLDPWGMFRPAPVDLTFSLPAASNTTLSPPKASWNWKGNTPALNYSLATVQKDWVWQANTPKVNHSLAAAQKDWVWAPNAPKINGVVVTVQKAWDWVANAPAVARGLVTTSKSWVWNPQAPSFTYAFLFQPPKAMWSWVARAAVLSGGNIPGKVKEAFNVMRPIVWGVVRGVFTWPRMGPDQ